MAKETPIQTIKRLYGSKDKLIESVVGIAKQAGEDAAEVKERLVSVSNRKLLRMAEVSKQIKADYGSKDKLVDALAKMLGRAKDNEYVDKLRNLSGARLLDLMKSAARRSKKAS